MNEGNERQRRKLIPNYEFHGLYSIDEDRKHGSPPNRKNAPLGQGRQTWASWLRENPIPTGEGTSDRDRQTGRQTDRQTDR